MKDWSPFRAYAVKSGLLRWQDWLCLAIFCGSILWLVIKARHLPAYTWSWGTLRQFLLITGPSGELQPGLLAQGLFATLRIGFWTFISSLAVGAILNMLMACFSYARLPCKIFINLLRGLPPLVILFCVYFFAGSLLPTAALESGIRALPQYLQTAFAWLVAPPGQLDRMFAAALALGCYQGAYVAEIFRGSLAAVPSGQWDAGFALGFGRLAALRLIILPQALRLALPALTGQCVTTFKESALASLISLPELTFQSLEIMAVSGMTFEIWFTSASLYLLVCLFWHSLGGILERRFSRHLIVNVKS